jgi:hypothetical protein
MEKPGMVLAMLAELQEVNCITLVFTPQNLDCKYQPLTGKNKIWVCRHISYSLQIDAWSQIN